MPHDTRPGPPPASAPTHALFKAVFMAVFSLNVALLGVVGCSLVG